MVPNHMGIDSRWVIEHPDWFLSLPEPPFPAYSFNGPDLSDDERVGIRIEDHYYDASDAAVVFQRAGPGDAATVRYVYHGNDGTTFPWNDTAQLDYSQADVREAVIQTIVAVARQFPVIRFDAAMVLAKRHIERLWFPEPGAGGAIPSRAGQGLQPAGVRGAHARRVLARRRRSGRRWRRPGRSCWPRRSGCSRATSSGRSGCTASTTAPS